jgi:hypothetical protein
MNAPLPRHIPNIGAVGARRRRAGGYVWIAVATVAAVALFATHAPRSWRLLLVLPLTLSAVGFLQAREKT